MYSWQYRRMPVIGDLNEKAISLEEVREAVNVMKSVKAIGLDGFPVECLKKCGMAVLKWLVRLLNGQVLIWRLYTYGLAW